MQRSRRQRVDIHHHHPRVTRGRVGWAWDCSCGGASCRTGVVSFSWRQALISAMNHAATLAP
jgi:hypothetical protein